jgi:peptide/nickel transport system permease protein
VTQAPDPPGDDARAGDGGIFIRLTRVNVIRTLRDDYIEAARARGIAERRVVFHHAFKNALVPVITIVGLNLAILLAAPSSPRRRSIGPGIGHELVLYLGNRDYAGVQGIIVVFAARRRGSKRDRRLHQRYVDPRIRY